MVDLAGKMSGDGKADAAGGTPGRSPPGTGGDDADVPPPRAAAVGLADNKAQARAAGGRVMDEVLARVGPKRDGDEPRDDRARGDEGGGGARRQKQGGLRRRRCWRARAVVLADAPATGDGARRQRPRFHHGDLIPARVATGDRARRRGELDASFSAPKEGPAPTGTLRSDDDKKTRAQTAQEAREVRNVARRPAEARRGGAEDGARAGCPGRRARAVVRDGLQSAHERRGAPRGVPGHVARARPRKPRFAPPVGRAPLLRAGPEHAVAAPGAGLNAVAAGGGEGAGRASQRPRGGAVPARARGQKRPRHGGGAREVPSRPAARARRVPGVARGGVLRPRSGLEEHQDAPGDAGRARAAHGEARPGRRREGRLQGDGGGGQARRRPRRAHRAPPRSPASRARTR